MANLKKVLLISAMALCLGGGVGVAVAEVTRDSATSNGTSGFDQAVNLYWGSKSTTATLENCGSLSVGTPVYRYLTVSPESTKSVSGTVTLTFTLSTNLETNHLEGLQVSVYKTEALATDSTVAALTEDASALKTTLSSDTMTSTTSFEVAASEDSNVHVTTAYYAIKLVYDGSMSAGKEFGGTLTISQSFAK